MPLLRQRTVILAKEETTEGVDASPSAADHALLAYNVEVNPISERLSRDPVRDTLSPVAILIGQRHYEVAFQTELYASGTAGTPTHLGDLFEACGMSETIVPATSVTYQPSSANHKSLTLYVYQDGMLKKILGCRGTWELILQAGQPVRINWRFLGLYQEPEDAALVSPTIEAPALQPPKALAANLTFNGLSSFVVQQLQLVLANALVVRPDVNAATGVKGIAIANRAPTGSFNPEAVLKATYNFWQDWVNSTVRQLSAQIGTGAGAVTTITCPNVALDRIGQAEREGILVFEIPFSLASTAGDDEVQLAQT